MPIDKSNVFTTIVIFFHLLFSIPAASAPIDLAFAMDRSGSTIAGAFAQQQAFITDFAQQLTFGPNGVAAALVSFAAASQIEQPLSTSSANLINAVQNVPAPVGQTCLSCGILSALDVLGNSTRPDALQAMIVFSDGLPTTGTTNINEIAATLGAAFNNVANIHTFIVSIETPDLPSLNLLALAGGGHPVTPIADFSSFVSEYESFASQAVPLPAAVWLIIPPIGFLTRTRQKRGRE